MAMAPGSPLLLLPAELRELVYGFYFTHDPTIAAPHISRSPLALAFTCRQLHEETHTRAFWATTFRAHSWHFWELETGFKQLPPFLEPNSTP